MISNLTVSVNGTDVTASVLSIGLTYAIGVGPKAVIVAHDQNAYGIINRAKEGTGLVKWSYRIDHTGEITKRELPSEYIDLQVA